MPTMPGKIICVGRNYAAHARELGNALPERPLLFFKPVSALIPTGVPVRLPAASSRVDFEGEIAVRLGARLYRATPDEARAAIVEIAPANDVTARDLQKSDGQWARAKGFDTFCPVGEFVSAPESIEDLEIVSRVNGEERQRGSVRQMIFPIVDLLSYVSGIMTLEPGDLLLTGTPEGVGPLADGDIVEIEIPGFGLVSNPVVADPH